jgi:hypothetical protein
MQNSQKVDTLKSEWAKYGISIDSATQRVLDAISENRGLFSTQVLSLEKVHHEQTKFQDAFRTATADVLVSFERIAAHFGEDFEDRLRSAISRDRLDERRRKRRLKKLRE